MSFAGFMDGFNSALNDISARRDSAMKRSIDTFELYSRQQNLPIDLQKSRTDLALKEFERDLAKQTLNHKVLRSYYDTETARIDYDLRNALAPTMLELGKKQGENSLQAAEYAGLKGKLDLDTFDNERKAAVVKSEASVVDANNALTAAKDTASISGAKHSLEVLKTNNTAMQQELSYAQTPDQVTAILKKYNMPYSVKTDANGGWQLYDNNQKPLGPAVDSTEFMYYITNPVEANAQYMKVQGDIAVNTARQNSAGSYIPPNTSTTAPPAALSTTGVKPSAGLKMHSVLGIPKDAPPTPAQATGNIRPQDAAVLDFANKVLPNSGVNGAGSGGARNPYAANSTPGSVYWTKPINPNVSRLLHNQQGN